MANTTTIGQTKHGQFLITLPKAIVQASGWNKGTRLEFIFQEGEVVLRMVKEAQRNDENKV